MTSAPADPTANYVIPYKPHRGGQHEFHMEAARLTRMLACGRRWGKDRATIQEMYRLASQIAIHRVTYREHYRSLVPLVHVWVVAPDYPRLDQYWTEMKAFIPAISQVDVNNGKKRMECTVTADREPQIFIELKSAVKPETLTSVGLDVLVITEAGLVKRRAWDEALQPCLFSPGRCGLTIMNGTPKGENWFKEEFDKCLAEMEEKGEDATRWAMRRSSYDNPLIDRQRIDDIAANMSPRKRRQEIMSVFLGAGDGFFPDPNLRMWPDGQALEIQLPIIIGCDWGRRANPTVFFALDLFGRMLGIEVLERKTFSTQFKALHKFVAQFDVPMDQIVFAPEANGLQDAFVERIVEEFRVGKRGAPFCEPFMMTGVTKPAIMEGLAFDLEENNEQGIWLLDDPETINQIVAFEEQDLRHTRQVVTEDDKGEKTKHHFDRLVALAIANHMRHDILENGLPGQTRFVARVVRS